MESLEKITKNNSGIDTKLLDVSIHSAFAGGTVVGMLDMLQKGNYALAATYGLICATNVYCAYDKMKKISKNQ